MIDYLFVSLMYRIHHFFTYNDQSYDKSTSEMYNEREFSLYCDQYLKELLEERNSAEISREVMNISVKNCG